MTLEELNRDVEALKKTVEGATAAVSSVVKKAIESANTITAAATKLESPPKPKVPEGLLAGVLYGLAGIMAASTAITVALIAGLVASGTSSSAADDPVRWISVHFLDATYAVLLHDMVLILFWGSVAAIIAQVLRARAISAGDDKTKWRYAWGGVGVASALVLLLGVPAAKEAACAGEVQSEASALLLKRLEEPNPNTADHRRTLAATELSVPDNTSGSNAGASNSNKTQATKPFIVDVLLISCQRQVDRWANSQLSLPPIPAALPAAPQPTVVRVEVPPIQIPPIRIELSPPGKPGAK
jgi:hypothetical protein